MEVEQHWTVEVFAFFVSVYIQNNRVRARVTVPNIPVANGVVHVIDNMLCFIYKTVFIETNTTKSLR